MRRLLAFTGFLAAIVVAYSLLATAAVPSVPSNNWLPAAPFGEIPAAAASAILPDGRVVVAGGQLADGSLTAAVAVYDPAVDGWTKVGDLLEARAGLAAAVAADGRVVIAGGRTAAGVTASVELFDLNSASSQAAGVMTLPRADAAAATLPDGRVLIAGGTDGASALAAAELFDPQTNTSQPAAPLAVGRARLSATTLLDGHVLVAGGNDGQHDLSIAEIYDPELGIFWETEWMNAPRSGHAAMRLPNSNTILVAGGMSNGTALKSAEQYAHWGQLWLAYEPLMSVARVGAIAAPTQRLGVVRIGGGGDASSEFYGYATLTTDKDDYAPYETVTISGGGWQPGETVRLRVSEDSDSHYDWELEAVADEFGNIVNQDFYPRQDDFFQHIGMRFYLSATGIASQAQTTFTDAGSIALDPSIGPVGTSVTVSSGGGAFGGNKNNIQIFWEGTTLLTTCSTNGGGNIQGTCAFSVPSSTVGPHTVTATQQDSPALSFSATFTVGAGSGDGTIIVNPSSVTGGTTGNNFTFTFTASGEFALGSQTTIAVPSGWTAPTNANTALAGSTCSGLSRSISSNTITVNMTCAAGQSFTLTYNGITAPAASGPYTFTTKTRQSSTGTLTNIASSPVVTVTPACTATSVTTQPSNQSVTYGSDATFTAAASGNPAPTVQWQVSTNGVDFTNLPAQTSTTLTLTKPAVSLSGNKYRAVFTNTCGGAQTATTTAATLAVAAKSLTGSFTAANKFYDGTTAATINGRSLSGAIPGEDVSLGGGSATFSDSQVANGKTVTATGFVLAGSAAGNYSLASSTLTTTADIKALAVTITANNKSKTYGQANPVFDAAVVGAVNGDVLAYSLASAADQTSGVGSYPIVVTLGANPNYDVTKHDGNLTIGKATASVTANDKSKTYGQANPVFDAAESGTVNGDVLNYSLATTATQFSGVNSYPITVTLGSNPNYDVTPHDGTLTVGKATASVTANDKSKTYGQANPVFDAAVVGAINGDVLAYSLASAAGQTSGVGSYPIVVTLGANPNYDVTKHDGNLTIGKATASVTASDESKTYGQANPAFDAAVVGAVNGDVLAYSLASAADQASGVGSYPIVVTLGANPNYDVTKHDGTLTVGKATASVTANDKSKTYGQANPVFDAAVVGAVNGDVLAYSLASVADQTSGVGSYPIVVTLGANPNYDATKHDGTLTVGKATASVTANDKNKTYGQANPVFDAAVVGAVNGDVLAYSLASAADQTSGVGSYPIVVTLGANPNYDVTKHDGTLTVGKATASVTANDKSKTYGQANAAFDAAVAGAVNGDTLAYSLASAADQTSGVGSYPIVVTLGSNPNYDMTKHDGTLTVGKATASVTANDKSKTYGQANAAFDAAVAGAVNGDTLAYSLASAADQTSGVGSYPIVVTLGSNPNYDMTKHDGTLTVGKATASVTANDKSKTYGQANPVFDAAVAGAVNGDVLAYSLASAADQTSGVGSYPIVVTLGANPNYDVTKHDGTLTIGKATASVTPNPASKTYGDADPTLTGALNGFLAADDVTATYSRTAGQTVGTYTIGATLAPAGVLGNYAITYNTATFGITQKAASVTPNLASKTYGDADPTLTGALSGFLAADGVTAAYSRTAGQTVGAYTISATLAPAGVLGNYAITYNTATFTITRRAASVTPNAASKGYGAADPALTGTLVGFLAADGVTATYSRTAGETVGPYTITAMLNPVGVLVNYAISYNTATFTISPWSLKGFYEPVGLTSSIVVTAPGAQPAVSPATVWNSIKGGQTVPLKFNIYRSVGGAQVTTVADAFTGAGFSAYQLPSCIGGYTDDEIALSDLSAGATELRWDGTQFIQNWKTPKVGGADLCYRAMVTAKDGSTITAFFKVKK